MAEKPQIEVNPFSQYVQRGPAAAAASDEPNPFSQYMPQPETAAPAATPNARPLSKITGASELGFPIFEDPEDNKAMMDALIKSNAKLFPSIVRGLRDPIDAGAQLLARGGLAVAPEGSSFEKFMQGQVKEVEDINKAAEEDYRKNWMGGEVPEPDIGRAVGNVALTAPAAARVVPAVAGLIPRTIASAGTGAISGAANPVDTSQNADFWTQKGEQVGEGAIGGAVAAPFLGGAARVVSPNVSPEVKSLIEAGVKPTPGQIMGGTANRIEEAAQSIPLVGDVIKSARGRAVEDLNRAAINRSLAPIGESLDKTTPMGREAVAEMHDKIGAAYDKLVPTLSVKADQPFVTNMRTLIGNAQYMPEAQTNQFNSILRDKVFHNFSQGGGMTGQSFKEVESELGRLATDYSNSAVASERQLGGALRQAQAEMREMLVRSNPDKAAELKAINSAFANSLRVEGAAGRIGSDQGVFTPAQLLSASRSLDPSLRKGSFARGGAMMQDLAEAGKSVLGNKVPDSGTPLRGAVMAGGGLLGLGAVSPLAAAGAAGAGLTAMAPYTKAGQGLAASMMASRPPGAVPLASLLRNPVMGTLPAALVSQQGGP